MDQKYQSFYEIALKAIDAMYLTIVIDKAGYIVYMGENYRNLFGLDEKDVIGKYIKEIIPNTKLIEVLESGKETIGEKFTLINGNRIICNRIPIKDDSENIIGVISTSTFYNITEVDALNSKIEQLKRDNENYKNQLQKFRSKQMPLDSIVGISNSIKSLKETIEKISNLPVSVLITGETGTGKEVFANCIHKLSPRSESNFIKINCAAIPKDLIESELFGYAPGAFSGALKEGKIGKFEMANSGSILLDEIGEMPLSLQTKLLRVLQEKEVVRVGDSKPIKLDVRIICSTNKNLEELISKGEFREDLYYRINVVEMKIPPLRERLDDIELFSKYFIDKFNNDYGLGINLINDDVIELFKEYNWPGNIRELENVIERACIIRASGNLNLEDFDFFLAKLFKTDKSNQDHIDYTLEEAKSKVEKEQIIKTIIKTKGNKTAAAKILGIDRTILYNKLKKYDINI